VNKHREVAVIVTALGVVSENGGSIPPLSTILLLTTIKISSKVVGRGTIKTGRQISAQLSN